MSERELLAIMAAIVDSGDTAGGDCVLTTEDCVTRALALLAEVDEQTTKLDADEHN